jgi:WD40 repeat protein
VPTSAHSGVLYFARPAAFEDFKLNTHTPHSPTPSAVCSADGVVKFWKKAPGDVEFVKTFKAHLGPIAALALSADGLRLCSAGCDKALKLFDVGASARCRWLATRAHLHAVALASPAPRCLFCLMPPPDQSWPRFVLPPIFLESVSCSLLNFSLSLPPSFSLPLTSTFTLLRRSEL